MSEWGKKSSYIVLCVTMLFIFAGCGKEKSDEEKMQEKVEQAFNNAGINLDALSDSDEKPTVESKLMEIDNFVIGDIWNDGFVNVGSFASRGKDATGQTMDIDFMLQQLGKSMEKKPAYDTYIQGLDSKYDNVKQLWTKVSEQIDALYRKVQETPPKANDQEYPFDTGLFTQYDDAFSKAVEDLNQN